MGCYETYVTVDGIKRCTDERRCPDCEIAGLRADLAALEQACKEVLAGTYYMDPPDGGDVPLTEQVLRMGKDAARYRHLRDYDNGYLPEENGARGGEDLDYVIDQSMRGEL